MVMRFQREKLLWGDAFSAWKTAQIRMGIVENSSKKTPGFPGAISLVLEAVAGEPRQQARSCSEKRAF